MTKRQQQLLAFLRDYIAENEYAPSYVEIAAHLGLRSNSGVNRLVYKLLDLGLISFEKGTSRTIRVTPDASDYQRGYRDGFAAGMVKQSSSMCA